MEANTAQLQLHDVNPLDEFFHHVLGLPSLPYSKSILDGFFPLQIEGS